MRCSLPLAGREEPQIDIEMPFNNNAVPSNVMPSRSRLGRACSQRAVSRFDCGKSSVIKQTLEMQGEDTSATRDPLKEACLARGVWVNS